MLLLLLLGAGTQTGVRAYGNTTYRAVSDSATVATSVTLADTDATPTTHAVTTEE